MDTEKIRKPLRRADKDYSAIGAYFLTVCTKEKEKLLWDMQRYNPKTIAADYANAVGAMTHRPQCLCPLNHYGKIVESAVLDIPNHYPFVTLDHFVVMPNHVHILLSITDTAEERGRWVIAPTGSVVDSTADGGRKTMQKDPSVSQIVRQFKTAVSRAIGKSIWQRSFYDRIVRNPKEYERIAKYIRENPLFWMHDENYI